MNINKAEFESTKSTTYSTISRTHSTFLKWRKSVKQLGVSGMLLASFFSPMAMSTSPLYWSTPSDSETRSVMLTLAISIGRIENASARDLSDADRRLEIDSQLQVIEELGGLIASESKEALDMGDPDRRHQVVVDNIDLFLQRVKRARQEIAKEPANYYLSGKIVGHCQVCHENRDQQIK